MKSFEFSIIASGLDPAAPDFETRFFDSGCDDATVSFQKGHIIVDFARDAETLDIALASAIENVLTAGAAVDRVEPDPLVSLIEIAARTGMSRAAMTQYSKGQRGKNFPAPVAKITSDSSLWDWAAVAAWFYRQNKVSLEVAVEAQIVKEANGAISAGQLHMADRLSRQAAQYKAALAA
jgi:predicted DNA-binding transcriptional regulator AlpA